MNASISIPVCILAGGASRRFGSNKALALLGGRPLISHVLERVGQQTQSPIAINCDEAGAFADFDLPLVPDSKWTGEGPLSGIFASITWARAQGYSQVATVSVDVPCLPMDLISKLSGAGAPSIASSGDRWHPVNGLWDTSKLDDLDDYLRSGERSVHGWAESCKARVVHFEAARDGLDPFYNINTPAELERISAIPKPDDVSPDRDDG